MGRDRWKASAVKQSRADSGLNWYRDQGTGRSGGDSRDI